MRLPNGEQAVVDVAKVRRYCLDPTHLRGRHKARVFKSALGYGWEDAEELRRVLIRAAVHEEAAELGKDTYGQLFRIDVVVERMGKIATVRSYWIIRHDEDFPRLVTCFVK